METNPAKKLKLEDFELLQTIGTGKTFDSGYFFSQKNA
jgi:hypothetical protein